MELYQLKTLVRIAETGSLTEAAAQLNTSQPAASAHLKALENEVGFPLFFRTSKGMILTDKGARLLPEARRILASVEAFHRLADALLAVSAEPVRIGLNTDGHLLRVGSLIERMAGRLPQTEPHFIEVKSEDFPQELAAGRISAGFFYGQPTSPAVFAVKLHTFRMVVVYPNDWAVPDKGGELTLDYLAEKPWIWTTQGCPFYRQSIEYFRERGKLPRRILHVDDESLIGNLVQRKTGCSLLAEPIARRFAGENKLRIWEDIDLRIDLFFGFPKEKRADPILQTLHSIVTDIWSSVTDGG